MSIEDLKVVHYIRRWSGEEKNQSPICGAGKSLPRTVAGNVKDSAGKSMNICPDCRRIHEAQHG